VAQAGRGRWKIAKEHNHGLKTKGYHVEHHLGPGQPSLAAVMLRLNLRALLFQTVLEWREAKYGLLRQVLARRQTFFHDIQAFRRDLVLDSWDHLMDVMIRGLELESPCDTSGSPKLELLGGRGGRWKRPRALPILILLLGAG